ncbi:hypothetical protein [Calothrix rhizosoleniae]|uniref:slr1957 family protein n=1 Tax=Calothrix rhizosoleniae TaxID=888997 RepID=UPI000B49F754|nr:hypothetical protein [Calothrix rhizosoleniae]
MKHYCDTWIEEWCEDNGWTDLFMERYNNYWAFPPGAVMPEPIPTQVLRLIKLEKGFTGEEKIRLTVAVVGTVFAIASSFLMKCPMPLVFAFAFSAVTMAQLEVEDA